jgi:hypothetical protein
MGSGGGAALELTGADGSQWWQNRSEWKLRKNQKAGENQKEETAYLGKQLSHLPHNDAQSPRPRVFLTLQGVRAVTLASYQARWILISAVQELEHLLLWE